MHGREMGTTGEIKRVLEGCDYLHVAVDDHSRVAFVCALHDEQGPTRAQFVADAAAHFAAHFAAYGAVIERVMTDKAMKYKRSKVFKAKLEEPGIAHGRTALYQPQNQWEGGAFQPDAVRGVRPQNRFHRQMNSDSGRSNPGWPPYNAQRPHTAIAGLTPLQRLRRQRCGKPSPQAIRRERDSPERG
jgi:Integrase core domain